MNAIASLFERPVIDPTRFWFFDIKLSATSIALNSSRDHKATSKHAFANLSARPVPWGPVPPIIDNFI